MKLNEKFDAVGMMPFEIAEPPKRQFSEKIGTKLRNDRLGSSASTVQWTLAY